MGKHAYEDGFAAGLRAAADEAHREARWHSERAVRGEGTGDVAHRLLTVERILRHRADAVVTVAREISA